MSGKKDLIMIAVREPSKVVSGLTNVCLLELSPEEVVMLRRYIGAATLSSNILQKEWTEQPVHQILINKGIIEGKKEGDEESATLFKTTERGVAVILRLITKGHLSAAVCPKCRNLNGAEREEVGTGNYTCGSCGYHFSGEGNMAGADNLPVQ